jgi:glycine hydroxymethyltransferase
MVVSAIQGPRAAQGLGRALGMDVESLFSGCPALCCKPVVYKGHPLWVTRGSYGLDDDLYSIIGAEKGVEMVWHTLCESGCGPEKAPEARQALRAAAGLPSVWLAGGDPVASQGAADRAEDRDATLYLQRHPKWFALNKPYFVGQDKLPMPQVQTQKETFGWAEAPRVPLQQTPLYAEHKALGARLIPFAGWEMPVWYTSVSDEHRAVRETAGLFDVAHMGTLEIVGPYAADFLDLVSVNYGRWMKDGESQYAALLDPAGHILDDMWVYQRAWDQFLVVVNAANASKDWAWLNAVNEGRVVVDQERPWVGVQHPAALRNLKDAASGRDQRVDIALQGPASLNILLACADDPGLRSRLNRLPRTHFTEGVLGGIELLISRTGYTGESIAFELLAHPDCAVDLWRILLDKGAPYGIRPCGLAARDSTRIEAGLPLYGHELAGSLDISLNEAGFAGYVKYHKPFFVGRVPYKAYNDGSERRVIRFQVTERGAHALRGGEPVVSKRGKVVGTVTSCALVDDRQIGMALVDVRYTEEGTELWIYPPSRKAVSKPPEDFRPGDAIALPVSAVVLSRFLPRQR